MASARIATLLLSVLLALAGCGQSAASWTQQGDGLLRENDLIGAFFSGTGHSPRLQFGSSN